MKRHIFLAFVLALGAALPAAGQTNGSNSSYSRFGLGLLADPSQGANRSMGGVGQGLRSGGRINTLNAASYSAVDSLTFLFDVGISFQRTRMTQGGSHWAANNTSFDYVTASFRLAPRLGMAIGFVPFSRIGYSFSQSRDVSTDRVSGESISQVLSYDGSGGLHECFVGLGWQPFRKSWLSDFSIGANIGFMWGSIQHMMVQTFTVDGAAGNTGFNSLATAYSSSPRTWKADVSLQFRHVLNPKNRLTVGATVGIGHTIGGESLVLRTSLSGDTIPYSAHDAYELPMTYSLGAGWEWSERLLVAADATLEQWEKCVTPQLKSTAEGVSYVPTKGSYTNRLRFNLGAEYVPARYDRAYLRRMNYRIGASYSTPYLRVNGADGPTEYSLTAGVGLPIISARSYVNVGLQWSHRQPSVSTQIKENTFCINVGLTFNERWFQKWKFR